MFLQLVLGGFAGLALIAKLYWRRFLVAVRPAPPDTDDPERESNGSASVIASVRTRIVPGSARAYFPPRRRILRALSAGAPADWDRLAARRLFPSRTANGADRDEARPR